MGSMGARHGGLIEVSGPRVTPRRSGKKRKGEASTVAQKASIKSRVCWKRQGEACQGFCLGGQRRWYLAVPLSNASVEWLARSKCILGGTSPGWLTVPHGLQTVKAPCACQRRDG